MNDLSVINELAKKTFCKTISFPKIDGNDSFTCKVPNNPDSNKLLNKLLDNPDSHMNILLNMYNNRDKTEEVSIDKCKETRIIKFFKIIDACQEFHITTV